MLNTAQNVLPIFLLIFTGWALAASGYVKANVGEVLSQFIFKVAVPVLLFRTLAEADFKGVFPLRLWIAYFSGVTAVWLIAHFWITRVLRLDHRVATIGGISSAFANTVFIGLPLLHLTIGPEGLVAFSVLIVVHQPALMITAIIQIERASNQGLSPGIRMSVFHILGRSLLRNPLVYGTVGGALYQLSGLPLAGMGKSMVDQVAAMAGPGTLLSLGMAMRGYKLVSDYRILLVVTVLKLIVMPAVVLAAAIALNLPWIWTSSLVLIASVPTGVNAWLIAGQVRAAEEVAAASITMTTILGVFSVTLWAWLLQGH